MFLDYLLIVVLDDGRRIVWCEASEHQYAQKHKQKQRICHQSGKTEIHPTWLSFHCENGESQLPFVPFFLFIFFYLVDTRFMHLADCIFFLTILKQTWILIS